MCCLFAQFGRGLPRDLKELRKTPGAHGFVLTESEHMGCHATPIGAHLGTLMSGDEH